MTRTTDFAIHLKKYLQVYLPGIQGLSQNTIYSYRDAMTLFLRYCEEREKIKIDKFSLDHFNKDRVLRFLEYLESDLKYSISSRNQRLAAIHAFWQFLLREDVSYLSLAQEILNIPMKKKPKTIPEYLSLEGVKLLLQQPNTSKANEYRDLAIMTLMYDTGARVQEIIDLKVGDIRTISPPTVTLHGKGDKTRCVPIMKETQAVIQHYLEYNDLLSVQNRSSPVFTNKYHAVGMYEQGRREPSSDVLVQLGKIFGVSVDYILTGTPSPQEEQRLQQLLMDRITAADQMLRQRKDRPFTRQELAVLFAAMLIES